VIAVLAEGGLDMAKGIKPELRKWRAAIVILINDEARMKNDDSSLNARDDKDIS
jgi:hypothetical protein